MLTARAAEIIIAAIFAVVWASSLLIGGGEVRASRDHAPNTCAATRGPKPALPAGVPFLRFYFGRDIIFGDGWCFWLDLIPRRDLTTAWEEGYLVLAGLHICARFRLWSRLDRRLRPRLFWEAFSDAREIADRIEADARYRGLLGAAA
jgi:hypothetical protein